MKWPWGHRLARLVRRQSDILRHTFDGHAYDVKDISKDWCCIEGQGLTIEVGRDWRDKWMWSNILFDAFPEAIPVVSVRRFLREPESLPVRGPLSEQLVREELKLVTQAVAALRSDSHKIKDAVEFFYRENEEYTRQFT